MEKDVEQRFDKIENMLMENEESKYGLLGLTDDEANWARDILSEKLSDIQEKSDGEILKELFNDVKLTSGQKFYIAYMFGRTRDKYFNYLETRFDTE